VQQTGRKCAGTTYYNKYQAIEPISLRTTGPRKKDLTSKALRPREEWMAFPVPPIVSEELWQKANEAVSRNRKMRRRQADVEYLLTGGHIVCDQCGYVMVGMAQQNTSGTLRLYYRCNGRSVHRGTRGEARCTSKFLRAETVDERVWRAVVSLLKDPEIPLKLLSDGARKEAVERDRAALAAMLEQDCALEDRLDALIELYETREISREKFHQRKSELDERRQEIEDQRLEIEQRIKAYERANTNRTALETINILFRDLDADLPTEAKRRILRTLNVKVHAVGDGTVYLQGYLDNEIMVLAARYVDGALTLDGQGDDDSLASAHYWFNLRASQYAEARGILVESLNTPGGGNGGEDKDEDVAYCTTPEGLSRHHAAGHVRAALRHGHTARHLRDARLRAAGDPRARICLHARREVRGGRTAHLQVRG
jgi:hypothetical protein